MTCITELEQKGEKYLHALPGELELLPELFPAVLGDDLVREDEYPEALVSKAVYDLARCVRRAGHANGEHGDLENGKKMLYNVEKIYVLLRCSHKKRQSAKNGTHCTAAAAALYGDCLFQFTLFIQQSAWLLIEKKSDLHPS